MLKFTLWTPATGAINGLFYAVLLLFFTQCNKPGPHNINQLPLVVDGETTQVVKENTLLVSNRGTFVSGGRGQVKNKEFNGNYAIKITPNHPYTFSTDYYASTEHFLKISVWLSSKNDSIHLIAQGDNFYQNSQKWVNDSLGWHQLQMKVKVPRNKALTFYLWLESKTDSLWADYFTIEELKQNYHALQNQKIIPNIALEIEDKQWKIIEQSRDRAMETGVMIKEKKDWATGILIYNEKKYPIRLRLKGDWASHMNDDKWSLRIQLLEDSILFPGLDHKIRTFNIQKPETRGFVYEFLVHKLFKQQGFLVGAYDFACVNINNKFKGLYALEEHIDDQILTDSYANGVLLKFDEDHIWQHRALWEQEKPEIPYFQMAPIKSIGQNNDKEVENAKAKLNAFRFGKKDVSSLFDVPKMAHYIALLEAFRAYHNLVWHNSRYCYNNGKLSPVLYDCYTESGVYNDNTHLFLGEEINKNPWFRHKNPHLYHLFKDHDFYTHYLKALHQYCDSTFINGVFFQYKNELEERVNLIKMEYPDYDFDYSLWTEKAHQIKSRIDKNQPQWLEKHLHQKWEQQYYPIEPGETLYYLEDYTVQVYHSKEKGKLEVLNFHYQPLWIVSEGVEIALKPYSVSEIPAVTYINGNSEKKIRLQTKEGLSLKTKIRPENYPWPK